MKKFFLLLAGVTMMASSAMAQMSLVKEAEKFVGSNNPQELMSALEKIEPATQNPESKDNALTWFTAGRLAFKLFDQMQALRSVGQDAGTIDNAMMGEVLNEGFDAMFKALSLDSVKETNKDGSFKLDKNGNPQIKTKYSKDIINSLVSHIQDAGRLADEQRGAENYAGAAKSYGTFIELVTSPFAKAQNINYADTAVREIRFLEGFCYFFAKDYANALPSLMASKKMGYTENQIDEFVVETVQNAVQAIVNNQEYAKAYQLLDNVIADDPNNARIYDVKGRVFEIEDDKNMDRAIEVYKKVVSLNPNYAQGFYDLGRALCLKAQNTINDNPDMTNAQLKTILAPIYAEAEPLLEKVCQLEPDGDNGKQAKRLIEDIDYKREVIGMK